MKYSSDAGETSFLILPSRLNGKSFSGTLVLDITVTPSTNIFLQEIFSKWLIGIQKKKKKPLDLRPYTLGFHAIFLVAAQLFRIFSDSKWCYRII